MLRIITAFLILIASSSLGKDVQLVVEDGDIIFQRSTTRQSHVIEAATGSPYTHMGIIFYEGETAYVHEAVQPVKKTKLIEWIKRGRDGKFVVRRLKDRSAVDFIKLKREVSRFIGLNYDHKFEWSDSQVYCSELVWKAYARSSGIEIGALRLLRVFNL